MKQSGKRPLVLSGFATVMMFASGGFIQITNPVGPGKTSTTCQSFDCELIPRPSDSGGRCSASKLGKLADSFVEFRAQRRNLQPNCNFWGAQETLSDLFRTLLRDSL